MAKVEVLRPYVEKVVREYLSLGEDDKLVVDDDGDIPIRWGSAIYYVRLIEGDPVLVRVFSVLLKGVEKSMELLEEINSINMGIVSARVFLNEKDIVAATEIPAETMDKEELSHACWAVGSLADWADTELATKFGGEKSFQDEGEGEQKEESVDV